MSTPSQYYTLGSFDSNGVPQYLSGISYVPPDMINRIVNTVPEGVNMNTDHPEFLTNTASRNVIIQSSDPSFTGADVYATFLYENAGYTNTVGYYVYPLQGEYTVPTKLVGSSYVPMTIDDRTELDSNGKYLMKHIIIFPNASLPSSDSTYDGVEIGNAGGGNLLPGSTVKLLYDTTNPSTPFPNNTGIGFFLMSDAFQGGDVTTQTLTFTDNVQRPSVVCSDDVFNDGGMRQTLLLVDAVNSTDSTGSIVISFEDISRATGDSDSDFNDVVMQITYTPETCFSTTDNDVLTGPNPITIDQLVCDDSGIYFQFQNSTVNTWYNSGTTQFNFNHTTQCIDKTYTDNVFAVFDALNFSNGFTVNRENDTTILFNCVLATSSIQNYIFLIECFTNRTIMSPINSNVSCLVDLQNIYIRGGSNIIAENTNVYDNNNMNTSFRNSSDPCNSTGLTTPYAMGDPHIRTLYDKCYELPNNKKIYKLYDNGELLINTQLNSFYANEGHDIYDKLTFMEYVSINVGNDYVICNMFHPDVYGRYSDGVIIEATSNEFPNFKFYKASDIPHISTNRIHEYKRLTYGDKFELRYVGVKTFYLGEIYVELMFIPHRRDYVNGISLIGDNLLRYNPKGALIKKNRDMTTDSLLRAPKKVLYQNKWTQS